MNQRLEEVQKKFDAMEEEIKNDSRLRNICFNSLGKILEYCKEGFSFAVWYNDCPVSYRFSIFNYLFRRKGLPEVTDEDLELLYEHTRAKILRTTK